MTKVEQSIPDSGGRYYAGDSAVITVYVVDEDGNDKDLSGAQMAFTVLSEGSVEIQKTINNGGITLANPSKGEAKIQIETSDTRGMGGANGESYPYEIVVEDASGRRATVTVGTWTIYETNTTLP